MPRVSVITPTWQRHSELFTRCIPSVRAQTFHDFEHLVVSDGPDAVLRGVGYYGQLNMREVASQDHRFRFLQLPEHVEPHSYGSRPRNFGAKRAKGEYIAYLDDDNSWRPTHLELLVGVLDANPGLDFAYSQMIVHSHPNYPTGDHLVGAAPPRMGCIDSSLIVHRRDCLERYGWWPDPAPRMEVDWDLIARWLAQGARWAFVPLVTLDYR